MRPHLGARDARPQVRTSHWRAIHCERAALVLASSHLADALYQLVNPAANVSQNDKGLKGSRCDPDGVEDADVLDETVRAELVHGRARDPQPPSDLGDRKEGPV
jgi:hypothetical protein